MPEAPATEAPAVEAPAVEAPAVEAPEAPTAPAAEASAAPALSDPAEAELAESMQSVGALELPVPDPEPAPAAAAPKPRPHAVPARPGSPSPVPTAAPGAPVAALPPLAEGAAEFGRVGEDGTVFVRDGDTERSVGQFPDVTPDEALALFVRKFVDLASQAHLLDQRLTASSVGAKEAAASLRNLREATVEPAVVGNLAALRAEIDRLDAVVAEHTAAEEAERARARAAALEQREAIVGEAEALASTDPQKMHFKNAGDRMQTLLARWKSAQRSGYRLDKKSEDVLWKRFSAARTSVDKLRRQHFSEVSEQRGSTKAAKEALIAEAEALQTSTDWRATGDAYRALMERWKSAGRLGRKEDDALWARFRAAQDVFFASRTTANQAQDEEYRANLEVKEKLLAEAEGLLPVADAAAAEQAKKALRGIQDRWDEAGRVPRADLERIEARLRKVLETVREAEAAKWGRGNPETVTRGSGLITQLSNQVADLDAKIEAAEARGDTKTAARARKDRQTKQAWLDQAQASLSELSR